MTFIYFQIKTIYYQSKKKIIHKIELNHVLRNDDYQIIEI